MPIADDILLIADYADADYLMIDYNLLYYFQMLRHTLLYFLHAPDADTGHFSPIFYYADTA